MVVVRLRSVSQWLRASSGKPRPWRIAALGVALLAQILTVGEALAQTSGCARCAPSAPVALAPGADGAHRAHPEVCASASPTVRIWARRATPSAAIRHGRGFPEEALSH